MLQRWYKLQDAGTTVRTEVMAGLTAFITVSYIIAVNGSLLHQAGVPYEAAMIATAIVSFFGCMMMSFYANSPFIVVPGLGTSAFFVFTLVASLGLPWQQALAVVITAGGLFLLITVTPFAKHLLAAIPKSLIHAMTAGIGFFIAFLGLKNGGLVVANPGTFVKMGNVHDPYVATTLITLLVMIWLFLRKVKGGFLLGILFGTLVGWLMGIVKGDKIDSMLPSFASYGELLGAVDFSGWTSFSFWIGVFALTITVLFENMGAQLGMIPDRDRFTYSFRAIAVSIIGAGLLGSSPASTAAESATGIAAGGKTGLTSLVAGLLFIPAMFCIPLLQWIPASAIAPILIIVGALMLQQITLIDTTDMSEWIPAVLLIALIPLTFSIANGIAIGFIAYALIKLCIGRWKEVSPIMYAIAGTFILYLILSV